MKQLFVYVRNLHSREHKLISSYLPDLDREQCSHLTYPFFRSRIKELTTTKDRYMNETRVNPATICHNLFEHKYEIVN